MISAVITELWGKSQELSYFDDAGVLLGLCDDAGVLCVGDVAFLSNILERLNEERIHRQSDHVTRAKLRLPLLAALGHVTSQFPNGNTDLLQVNWQ